MTWTIKRNAWPPCYLQPPFASGRYYPIAGYSVTTCYVFAGFIHGGQIWVPSRTSFDRLACEISSAGAAGSLLRMAIYDSQWDGVWPDKLVLDGNGALAADSVGGKEHAIAVTLQPGIYWLVVTNTGDVSYRASIAGPVQRWRSADPSSLGQNYAGWGLEVSDRGLITPDDGWPARFFQPSDIYPNYYIALQGTYPRLMLRAA
jgi:hypothetical protein